MKALSKKLLLPLFLFLGIVASSHAQSVTITNGIQRYASLTNTIIDMSGKCELWVTNSATPLSNCTINLNSVDAWLFLPAIKPSTVATPSYLSQVFVNGAAAAADKNVRVVQYGQNGTVLIPHPSTFQPLTVFTGAEFNGKATPYGQWSYYKGSGITNISSFKLKRGYQAVLAQSADGKSYSQCYVAQDGDLEIGVLPPSLDKQVRFIYVTPWRWTSKKGIAGNPGNSRLALNWWYNWNLDQSSSRDLEYVAIRQNQYWPGLSQNWQTLGINTVLGYNEPDHTDQANMTVSTAISSWGDLLGTGLRVGSPAPSDGGPSSWLYPFIQQADGSGLRVDFVAVHYYQAHNPADPSGAASQMYNFLLNVWNNTHRPIWITEWNNGANWTDNNPWPVPTYAQQQACIAAMINMLESTPFVERYALYNWVEDGRALITSSNTVTPAGTTYSNLISNLSYSQALPDSGTRGIAQYLFASNTWDTSGYYNNAMAVGAPSFTTGHNPQANAIVLDGANSYLQLPANIAKGSGFTFAAWVYWNGGAPWQRIFDFGSDTSHYLFLTPNSGNGTLRFAINNGSGEQIVQRVGALPSGSWQHVAVTLNGSTAIIYLNGTQVASSTTFTIAPSVIKPTKNYVGKSQFADPLFNGKLDDVEITDYAMTAAQISTLYNSAQPPTSGIWTNDADGNWGTTDNWKDGLIPSGTSRMADFSTLDLSAERTITLDTPQTIGGLRFGNLSGSQSWTLAGSNTLTLDGGVPNAPIISVNNNTATLSAPLTGPSGFAKNGNGTLVLSKNNTFGGGLSITAGSVTITNGSNTFGPGTSYVGYLTGNGNLNLTDASLATSGELRVGGSDQSGQAYNATGNVTLSNATLLVNSLTLARGNYLDNSVSGTLTLNPGSTLISTNDVVVEFAGTGRGKLAINGGNLIIGPTATKWLMVGYYDSGAGELDITNGSLVLENSSSLKMCRSGNTGSNVVNQLGGAVTFYSDAGATIGGNGNLDLNYAGVAASSSTYNLNGGTLSVPQVIASSATGTSTFNFNGGTLTPTANNTSFLKGLTRANIRNSGATIDSREFNITIAQPLSHSTLPGDTPIDGGLTKLGSGTLTLTATNTYTGTTTIREGTLALGNTSSIANSKTIQLAGGTLDLSTIPSGFPLTPAQTLSGNGAVNGTVVNNGTISPSLSGNINTLTFSTPPVLNDSGITLMKVTRQNGTLQNDQISLPSSAIDYGGTLTVTNTGDPLQAGDTFQLFRAANHNGSFLITNLPALQDGLTWSNSLALNGSITVISTASPTPPNILWTVNNSTLTLSYPPNLVGWVLQVQTNPLTLGISTNWINLPLPSVSNTMNFPLDTTNGSVFYRLVLP